MDRFWTCTAGKTFLGCCKSNPCGTGRCPQGDLEPALLNREDLRIAYSATGGPTAAPTVLSTASPTSTAPPAVSPLPSVITQKKLNVGAIAGAAGGAVAFCAVVGFLIYYICHAKRSRRKHRDSAAQRVGLEDVATEKDKGIWSPESKYYTSLCAKSPLTSPASTGWPSPSPHGYYQDHYRDQPYPPYSPESDQFLKAVPAGYPSPPMGGHHYRHVRGISELSGVTAASELESPFPSPAMQPGVGQQGFDHAYGQAESQQYGHAVQGDVIQPVGYGEAHLPRH